MTSDWANDKYVQNWFQLISNERTEGNYKRDFPKFLNWMQATNEEGTPNTPYKTPTEVVDSRLEQLITTDLAKRRYWEQQVVKFKNYLETVKKDDGENYRMATIRGYIRTVQSFFSANGVKLQFSRGEIKINPSEADKVDNEWIPSNEEVRLLYRLADGARDRAVLLTLYQSGFSEVDAGSMKIETFPFYDEKGDWVIPKTEDLYRKQRREKTNEWQQTCLSRETLEEIRIMLQSRGYPKEGYLFVSFRGEPLGVRGINEIFKGSTGKNKRIGLVEKAFNGKSKLWKTKHLRDAFMNGLLQAKLTQEVKDAMVGHRRQGARNDYAITELTIKTAYTEAFKFLSINGYGSQSRKLAELEQKFDSQTKTLTEIITELRTENKQLKQQLSELKAGQSELRNEMKYVRELSNEMKMYRTRKNPNK